jgi:hypothetical protein
MKIVLAAALVLAVGCGHALAMDREEVAPKTSFSTDFSDVWWTPSESGWGMPLVQQHNFIFATLFIYGVDGKATWVSAQLLAGAPVTFSGPLFVSSGPYYGGAFNPAAVNRRQAGSMQLDFSTIASGTVTYTIDGVTVTKPIQRMTLVSEAFSGTYVVAVNLTQSGCTNPAGNGTGSGSFIVAVAHSSSQMAMTWDFPDGSRCAYAGAYFQNGHFGAFSGPYTCTTGEAGSMDFFEMTNRKGMMSGRLRGASTNVGCQYAGRFTGLDPTVP